MPGIDQTLDSKALTKIPSIGQCEKDRVKRNSQHKEESEQQVMEDSIWAPRVEKTKRERGEWSCGGLGRFHDTAWGKNDHFGALRAPLLHFSGKNRNSSASLDYRVCAKGIEVTERQHEGRDHGLEKHERGCNFTEIIVYLRVACGKRGKGELSNECRL